MMAGRPARAAWLVFGVAVVARLTVGISLLDAGDRAYVLASDDGDAYVAVARHMAFGEPIAFDERLAGKWAPEVAPQQRWPAGYWVLLAANYRLFGYQHVSTIVLQALLGGLTAWASYGLARQVLGPVWALLAGLAVALSSTLVYLSAALYAEALYIPLLLLGLLLVTRQTRGSMLWAGVAFGLAEATRPLALPVFAVAAAWTLCVHGWRLAIVTPVGFALAVLPFLGRLNVFTAGAAEAQQDLASASITLVDRVATLFVTGGWAPLFEPLPNVSLRTAFWIIASSGAVFLLRRSPRRPAVLLVLAATAIVLPPLLVGLPVVRYRAPADPLFILFFVAAFAHATPRRHPIGTHTGRPKTTKQK
jgi:hypothetical protein